MLDAAPDLRATLTPRRLYGDVGDDVVRRRDGFVMHGVMVVARPSRRNHVRRTWRIDAALIAVANSPAVK